MTSPLAPAGPELEILPSARESENRWSPSNAGASLIDLGDGVLAVSLHSKMNAIGGDALEMLQRGVREASDNFAALVVAAEGPNFSVGANLMLLLLEAQEGNWEDIDAMIRQFQKSTIGLRYSEVPVVVAPFGMTLGGGCEIVLHGDRVQAAAESYIGLVEAGVGLIPAGGGTKEMLLRLGAEKAFETIGFGKTSTSAPEARRLGYLRDVDGWTMNRDRLVFDAKQLALKRVQEGYRPPLRPVEIPVGGDAVRATLDLGVHLAWRAGRISDHDAVIGRKLSWILAGGSLPHAGKVSEDQLLDLEREAFLSLCGERKDAGAHSVHTEDRQDVEKLMVDVGAGTPLVLVPGIQGRWEWMQPSVEALARDYRVITASLPGEPGVGMSFGADSRFRRVRPVPRRSARCLGRGERDHLRRVIWRAHRSSVCGDAQRSRPRVDSCIDAGASLEDEPDPGTICKLADSRQSAVRGRRRSARMAGDVRAVSACDAPGCRPPQAPHGALRERRRCRAG